MLDILKGPNAKYITAQKRDADSTLGRLADKVGAVNKRPQFFNINAELCQHQELSPKEKKEAFIATLITILDEFTKNDIERYSRAYDVQLAAGGQVTTLMNDINSHHNNPILNFYLNKAIHTNKSLDHAVLNRALKTIRGTPSLHYIFNAVKKSLSNSEHDLNEVTGALMDIFHPYFIRNTTIPKNLLDPLNNVFVHKLAGSKTNYSVLLKPLIDVIQAFEGNDLSNDHLHGLVDSMLLFCMNGTDPSKLADKYIELSKSYGCDAFDQYINGSFSKFNVIEALHGAKDGEDAATKVISKEDFQKFYETSLYSNVINHSWAKNIHADWHQVYSDKDFIDLFLPAFIQTVEATPNDTDDVNRARVLKASKQYFESEMKFHDGAPGLIKWLDKYTHRLHIDAFVQGQKYVFQRGEDLDNYTDLLINSPLKAFNTSKYIKHCISKNLEFNSETLDDFFFELNGLDKKKQELFTRLFDKLNHLAESQEFSELELRYRNDLIELGASELDFQAMINALEFGAVTNDEEYFRLLDSMGATLALERYFEALSTDDEYQIKDMQEEIFSYTSHDSNPHTEIKGMQDEELKFAGEVERVMFTAFDHYRSFDSLAIDGRSTPTGKAPLLARFGQDMGTAKSIYAEDIMRFPGRGVEISAIDPARLIPQTDRNLIFTENYQQELDDLANTRFFITRGMIAISNPSDVYKIKGRDGKPIQYSYVFFNDHFHQHGYRALLVPTQILDEKIQGSLITTPGQKAEDINDKGLLAVELIRAAEEKNMNVINVADIVCYPAGFAKAFPQGSAPYQDWDNENSNSYHGPGTGEASSFDMDSYRDIAGHCHHWFIDGLPNDKEIYDGYMEAHDVVYNVTSSYQNLFDIFRLGYSEWKKGNTGTKDPDRVFKEALEWNKLLHKGEFDREKFPVIVLGNALDYVEKPDTPFIIDTYDLSFTSLKKIGNLPEKVKGEAQLKEIMQSQEMGFYISDLEKDFKICHRGFIN